MKFEAAKSNDKRLKYAWLALIIFYILLAIAISRLM
jgi:type IV secretory pathway component VirB8